jgi:hypothetical protein
MDRRDIDVELGQIVVFETYRPRMDEESAVGPALAAHWPVLHALGFVEPIPPVIYRRRDEDGRVTFVEIFVWKPGAWVEAHQHPDVGVAWEALGRYLERDGDALAWEFPHYTKWSAAP